ncbi:CLUMA_CG010723, isoform A [Clunio marinus]|uniref:CLUMA_CG010723, isoform A n=1 Tax=Clunio marinus TaxID=568069 RepID=A0A1J1IC52_9DIPT|nr:CLUMA_CG010723, isoform A [Clunio marinus]
MIAYTLQKNRRKRDTETRSSPIVTREVCLHTTYDVDEAIFVFDFAILFAAFICDFFELNFMWSLSDGLSTPTFPLAKIEPYRSLQEHYSSNHNYILGGDIRSRLRYYLDPIEDLHMILSKPRIEKPEI